MKMNILLAGLSLCLALSACGGPKPVSPGTWRAVIELPGGELPVSMQLEQTGDNWVATFINGAERVRVPATTISTEAMTLALPAFNTRIDATRDGDGFAGTLTLVKRGGKQQMMPFRAEPNNTRRFVASTAEAAISVAGRWEVEFTDDDGDESIAVGEFEQDGNTVQGTFLTPTGDYRFLAGEVDGDRLQLSTFDGSHAFLFSARLVDDELAGDFWSGTSWHESWSARRNENASLPDAYSLTQLVGDNFEFEFPDTRGRTVSFADERFQGKVILVTLAGSWCPNCHDEAAFLSPFYKKYRDQGLEMVGLMFEHMEDFDDAVRQINAFRDKFEIEYPLLVAGSSDKTSASRTMKTLDRVYSFPTSVFIDREGKVRRIHTGFTGPGTGQHYQEL
ncbi:MAG: TlpA family protein disulfide reductase, partial [Gammaproteobacteria bacterium]|nr:TlpA family protein disulfide reductase [Gammaproteobacteria bacterium]